MQVLNDSVGMARFGDRDVRRLGYGAARLSSVRDSVGRRDRDLGRQVCRHVVDCGVNFLDVAALYGGGECEEIIAEALYPYAGDLLIASKAGLQAVRNGSQRGIVSNGKPDFIRSECERSLSRLRVDVIDVYQLHSPDPEVAWEDNVGVFAELRREGKIRHVGLSNVSVAQLEAAERIVPIVSVQNLYNIATRQSEDVLKACEARSIPFIPYNPNHLDGTVAEPVVAEIAAAHGVSPQQVAVRWLLDHSPVMAPIPGTTSSAHVEDNVGSARVELNDEDRRRLAEVAPPP